jgi:DivIVA domain-containing protein
MWDHLAVIVVWVVAGVAVVAVLAFFVAGRVPGLGPNELDQRPAKLPDGPISAGDIRQVEFQVVLRGYRMDQVDAACERLAEEAARRDAGHDHSKVEG